nr:MAG TPA: hypothetical protein [Caudoviricetes sp.]
MGSYEKVKTENEIGVNIFFVFTILLYHNCFLKIVSILILKT